MPTVRSSQPRQPRTLTPEQRLERMVKAAEASASQQIATVQEQQVDQQESINGALTLAGFALETADGAAGGATRSGSSSSTIALTDTFAAVTQVDLLTVSAGDLTFPGANYSLAFIPPVVGATYLFEYQIIEVDNGIDNGVVFPGSFTAYRPTSASGIVITDISTTPLADFVDSRTTIGSISYRVEARYVSGSALTSNLIFNLFARRAA